MKLFAAAILLFSAPCFGQKIAKNEIDKFTKQKRVETEIMRLHEGFANLTNIKFRSVDTSLFLTMSGNEAVGTVRVNDPLTFLFEDQTTFDVFPVEIQTYTIGVGRDRDWYSHQYRLSKTQLEILASKKVISFRRTFNSNYADIDIKDKRSKKLLELAAMMLKELH